MDELLSLKWNNHKSSFLKALSQLRIKDSYSDVVLACEGKLYNVHKLVLSTCSDYFSNIFETIECKNPVIILKDIKCKELESLLDYMYLGEVNVSQIDLASLIKTAECLQLKGLALPDEDDKRKLDEPHSSTRRKKIKTTNPPPVSSQTSESDSAPSTSNNLQLDTNINFEKQEIFIKDEVPDFEYIDNTKEEFSSYSLDSGGSSNINIDEQLADNSNSDLMFEPDPGSDIWRDIQQKNNTDLNETVSTFPINPDEPFDIPSRSAQRNSLTYHPDPRTTFQCMICDRSLPSSTPTTIRRHMRIHTGEKPFGCPHCDFCSNRKTSAHRHMLLVHNDNEKDNVIFKGEHIFT